MKQFSGRTVAGFIAAAACGMMAAGLADQRHPDSIAATVASQATRAAGPPMVRSIDGRGNNLTNPTWGAAEEQLLRVLAPEYADGFSAPAGATRASARHVSNMVCDQTLEVMNTSRVSSYIWQWGQFLDHDIDLTEGADPAEALDIPVPAWDAWFDPMGTGSVLIFMNRSVYDPDSLHTTGARQQLNEITAYIDASMVYGSDDARARALRMNDGTGRLKTSADDMLPYNVDGLPNAGGPDPSLFLAGDVRCNEQVGLISLHTLFVREHNRLADELILANPTLTGEQIYQMVRHLVGAQIQVITYEEFLPLLLGPDAIVPYSGYDPAVNAGIMNAFSTACYRVGHSMLPVELLRLDNVGEATSFGHLALADAFFTPETVVDEGGLDPLLRGLAAQPAQQVDTLVTTGVRNFLFGPPGAGGFDLASLNIQRGRDHGLPHYNAARAGMGLAVKASFADVSSDPAVQSKLAQAYVDVNDMDMWAAGLAEDHVEGAMVGELFHAVLVDQFTRLRDGDRFWYENMYPPVVADMLRQTTLADVIRRNTGIGSEIRDQVFLLPECPADCAPPGGNGRVTFDDLIAVVNAISTQDLNCDVAPENGDGTFGDGNVNIDDILAVVNGFGICF